jgi:hypothetical protein
MVIRYKDYTLKSLPDDLLETLIDTCTSMTGRMGRMVTYEKSVGENYPVVVAFCNQKPVAWTSIGWLKNQLVAMVYVQYDYRRIGVGTNLIKKIQALGPGALYCCPWDKASMYFYKKNPMPVATDFLAFRLVY